MSLPFLALHFIFLSITGTMGQRKKKKKRNYESMLSMTKKGRSYPIRVRKLDCSCHVYVRVLKQEKCLLCEQMDCFISISTQLSKERKHFAVQFIFYLSDLLMQSALSLKDKYRNIQWFKGREKLPDQILSFPLWPGKRVNSRRHD